LGHVALFDRHAVDALLRPGPKTFKSTVSYSLLSHSCAKPDTFVVLDAPGEVMFARKGEHDVETLEERRQRYLDLQDRYPNVAVVDATQSADDVLRDVSALIWSLYSAPPS
jgi:thymidylate kinase